MDAPDGQNYPIENLSDLVSPDALKLLAASGRDFVNEIGIDVIRGVVLDVLTGRNLRSSTERITRRRIADLNLALVMMFLEGVKLSTEFIDQLPYLATDILARKRLNKSEKWLAQWILGLTSKSVQNVLRDDPEVLIEYRDYYIETCRSVIDSYQSRYGELIGQLEIGSPSKVKAELNWLFLTYLLNAVGAQTLTIRGSEKSSYGKLFENLVLGSLLYVLGFQYVPSPRPGERVFWLSSRGEKRESDATLLYQAGQGVRFDIGFIGRGNPEISLDKVTRFEREVTYGRTHWYMATIIIVDTIGKKSKIKELAENIQGTIIQMSASYWPQQVAIKLYELFGFDHELVHMDHNDMDDYLRQAILQVPLETFIAITSELRPDIDNDDSNEQTVTVS